MPYTLSDTETTLLLLYFRCHPADNQALALATLIKRLSSSLTDSGSQKDGEECVGRKRKRKDGNSGNGEGGACSRGGRSAMAVWASMGEVQGSQQLPQACLNVLASLSSRSTETEKSIASLKGFLSGKKWKEGQNAFQEDSLANLILRCQRVEEVESGIQFTSMINFIQLAAKVESIRRSNKIRSGTEVLRLELAKGGHKELEPRTLQNWLANGSKYAALAGAGSLYLLMLIACHRLKSSIGHLPGDLVQRLASVIRHPSKNTAFGRLVIDSIIPTLTNLQDTFPLTFPTVFSYQFLQEYKLLSDFNAANLENSDIFFDSLPSNGFIQERNWDAWRLWKNNTTLTGDLPQLSVSTFNHTILSIGSSSANIREVSPCSEDEVEIYNIPLDSNPWEFLSKGPLVSSQTTHGYQIVTRTKFDSNLPENRDLICPRKEQREERFNFTLGERKRAESARVPSNVDEMQNMIQTQLSSGKKPSGSYLKIRTALFPDNILRINEHDDSLLVIIIPTMPKEIRKSLLDSLSTTFPGKLDEKDTKALGINNYFEALHLSWYNRYSTRGDDAPKDVNPSMLTKLGKKRACPSQFIPRVSKELQDLLDDYGGLQQMFEPLFTWLGDVMAELLPEHHKILKQWVELLPSNDFSPVFPFGGLVINMNVATCVHRDWEDLSICFILEISNCEGGELCLMEPGLVIELQNGDGVAFCSNKITHFNLDYKGKRASLVFHSDRAGLAWCEDGNGWKGNQFFSQAE